MLKHGKTALIVAITLSVLGATSAALAGAKDDDGGGAGGFVIPGSTVGVNPVYHPDVFGAFAQAQTSQSSQSKKASKQDKKESANSSKGETEEQARLRRFYDNR